MLGKSPRLQVIPQQSTQNSAHASTLVPAKILLI